MQHVNPPYIDSWFLNDSHDCAADDLCCGTACSGARSLFLLVAEQGAVAIANFAEFKI